MELYTESAIDQLYQEREAFGKEAEILEDFGCKIPEYDISGPEDLYVVFYCEVWRETCFSDFYSDQESSRECFMEEFGNLRFPPGQRGFIRHTESLVRQRKSVVNRLDDAIRELENHRPQVEKARTKIMDIDVDFDEWCDLESAWNRIRIYERDLDEIALERQKEDDIENEVLGLLELPVRYPVLADVAETRQISEEIKSGLLRELPLKS